jgi:hypothetical protein
LISGIYPELWTRSCIAPLHKKGDFDDVNNYRGTSIVSCFGKPFTSVLNSTILEWDNEHNVLTDAQFGFRPEFSTLDATFVLQSLINKTFKNKKLLYCCFVDFQRRLTLSIDTSYGSNYVMLVLEENYTSSHTIPVQLCKIMC